MSKKDVKFMEEALRVASFVEGRCKHGAVITKNGRIISKHTNTANCHAEISALNSPRLAREKKRYRIYIARLGDDGFCKLSKPCVHCIEALKGTCFKKIYYTVDSASGLQFICEQVHTITSTHISLSNRKKFNVNQ